MKSLCGLALVIMAVSTPAAMVQTVKSFAKEGLIFNYPAGWMLQDNSTLDKQELTLARGDSDAQIRLFAYRAKIETVEQFAEARTKLIDPFIDSNFKTFQQMGASPERLPGSSEIGGVKADGVKIRAVLDGEPGAAETYWAMVGQRLVVMTFFGPDKALKQMTPAWDVVRKSLQIEGPKTETTPSSSTPPQ